jgi:hypothetical protein
VATLISPQMKGSCISLNKLGPTITVIFVPLYSLHTLELTVRHGRNKDRAAPARGWGSMADLRGRPSSLGRRRRARPWRHQISDPVKRPRSIPRAIALLTRAPLLRRCSISVRGAHLEEETLEPLPRPQAKHERGRPLKARHTGFTADNPQI